MESGYIQPCNKGSRQSEHQKSDMKFKEYSILCMGRCKPLGSLNLFLLYALQLSGAKSYFLVHLQFSSVQSFSRVQLFATPWTAASQASLSITNSWNLLKLMSIELVMPSNHLILCRPLLLLPSIPSIRVFANESILCLRWPKYWIFSFNISPS